MITRSYKNTILPRVYTKSVNSLCFGKCKDSDKSVINLIQDAITSINRYNKGVIISLVIPDSHYKYKYKNKIHQGHTFAVTRDDKYILVYDIHYDEGYKSNKKYYKNYQFVINKLKGNRKIIYFFKNCKKKGEGLCFDYIKDLENRNLILNPKDYFRLKSKNIIC